MNLKVLIVFLLVLPIISSALTVQSSFWAPLFDRRILNYVVNVNFDPESGKKARVDYQNKYGYRGAMLIDSLGTGGKMIDKKSEEVSINRLSCKCRNGMDRWSFIIPKVEKFFYYTFILLAYFYILTTGLSGLHDNSEIV